MTRIRDKHYQSSHRAYPCVFCGVKNETVCGHHVRISAGMGLKPCDASVLPTCSACHGDCHEGIISKREQTRHLDMYRRERMIEKYGVEQAEELLSIAYWSVL